MIVKRKDKSKKIKVYGAKVYAAVLVILLVAFFNPFTAVMVALLMFLGCLVYRFLKYVMLFGNLNEDLREHNN